MAELTERLLANIHPDHVAIPSLVEHLLHRRRIFKVRTRQRQGSWLVVPFHPRISRLNLVLKSVAVQWESSAFAHLAPSVSWKLEHKSLAAIVSSDAKKKIAKHRTRVGGNGSVFFVS